MKQAALEKLLRFYLYIIDEEQRLKGVVSLKQLILVRSKLTLKDIMNPNFLGFLGFLGLAALIMM